MKHAQDELVWIDTTGAAHPIGEEATRRMKAREGAFRVMPSPRHLVFLRFVGNDGRRDREDGPVVKLAGEITASGSMADVIAILGQVDWRGELVVQDSQATRSIFFEGGTIVGVQTDVEDEKVGMIAYRYGALSEEQVFTALERARAGGQRFGNAAVQLKYLTEEQVYGFLARQVEEVVFSVLGASDGMYAFLDGFEEGRLVSRQVHGATSLLMQLIVRLDGIRFFRPWIPSAEYVAKKRPGARHPGQEFDLIWAGIDGRRSVEELGRATGLGEFQVTEMLFRLTQTQHVIILPPRLRGGAAEAVELANTALRAIHQAADAGGRGTALRNGILAFARGTYDDLLRGAGPFEHGGFAAAIVDKNANAIVANLGGELETMVREMMYDYVAFALFSASASLGKAAEQSLAREVEPLLAKLRPVGQSGMYRLVKK